MPIKTIGQLSLIELNKICASVGKDCSKCPLYIDAETYNDSRCMGDFIFEEVEVPDNLPTEVGYYELTSSIKFAKIGIDDYFANKLESDYGVRPKDFKIVYNEKDDSFIDVVLTNIKWE